jgi:hypothetical protein
MVVWIAFTVVMGALTGTIVTALVFRGKTTPVTM